MFQNSVFWVKICFFNRYLSTGDTFRTIPRSYRVGESTVSRIVQEMCKAVWDKLQELYMGELTEEDWKSVSKEFTNRWKFNNCIGDIDGKHVTIHAPTKSGTDYLNYKKTFSIVLLAVVDAQYQFLIVDIGSKGRFSDGGILSNSVFLSRVNKKNLNIPADAPLEEGGQPFPFVFVGDEAFPLRTYLMRPYPRVQLDKEKRIFNYRLSLARRIVENAFGILARRWRVYKRPFECKVEVVVDVVKATCVLHNFIMKSNSFNIEESNQSECIYPATQLAPLPHRGGSATDQAFQVREGFKKFCNSAAGVLPYQENRIENRLHQRN